MNKVEIIKLTDSEKHRKLSATLHAWAKRKEERQKQAQEDFKAGKYDDILKDLREKKQRFDVRVR